MARPNPILEKMLGRLYGALMRGPQLNCSPHGRRQRFDLTTMQRLDDGPPERVLRELLSSTGKTRIRANVAVPPQALLEQERKKRAAAIQRILETGSEDKDEPKDPRIVRWEAQQKLLLRLRHLGEDALAYSQETGVEALEVGYPILSLPPGTVAGGKRRILAPVALIGCSMTVRSAGRAGVELACRASDVERVVPNAALFAWLSRELGTKPPEDLFADEAGEEPWREIAELTRLVADWLDLRVDIDAWTDPEHFALQSMPRTPKLPDQRALLPTAVLGLFPASNQGLLRDTHALLERDHHEGPIRSFLTAGAALDPELDEAGKMERDLAGDRLILPSDPMQAQAVRLARHHRGLVVHGPPGTGKSQTIANMIGDHLCRGERVLFVCEKRTALDVVSNRLRALGLDGLCALVHDPQRDRRELFMHIRRRLDQLTELTADVEAGAALEQADAKLREVHGRLENVRRTLGDSMEGETSFHNLTGRWLELANNIERPIDSPLEGIVPSELESHRETLERIFTRGLDVAYASQPWVEAAGGSLAAIVASSIQDIEKRLERLALAARRLDEQWAPLTGPDGRSTVEPFGDGPLGEEVVNRESLADRLEAAAPVELADRRRVAELDQETLESWRARLDAAAEDRERLLAEPLDAELDRRIAAERPSPTTLAQQSLKLQAYLESHAAWWGFFRFGTRSAGRETLGAYGLGASPGDARRLLAFLRGVERRDRLAHLLAQLRGSTHDGQGVPTDRALVGGLADLDKAVQVLEAGRAAGLGDAARRALAEESAGTLAEGLRQSRSLAEKLEAFEAALDAPGMLSADYAAGLRGRGRRGEAVATAAERLHEQRRHLEDVHRLREDLDRLPPSLRAGCEELLARSAEVDIALASLRHRAIENALRSRLAADPRLASLDQRAIEGDLETLRQLIEQKRQLVLERIGSRWTEIQTSRLLAGTGTKLNSLGASVRQRLYVRGRRAMKLRQVMRVGRAVDYADGGDDPLFDLCPVWMCSPETVAQIFPLEQIFDVVIFDEASQCRLEEALPVLVRARRVVIAGDPHQLPPTRFFEAAVASSEAQEIETEDDLFEAQQTEIEDLLGAALQLDVQESYLDVHYRSRHSTLIDFSNQYFYGNRLQALPGHPEDLVELAPIRLRQVAGVYEKRSNRAEAEAVVELVDELLSRDEPPSLGIATFNLVQKDLVADLLAEKAEQNSDFRRRYEEARSLERDGSFEGLFVKNLENVQGDERDHIIISTTYGVDAEGKFYRRFGPLGARGGGRRLNVLVTRARHELHLLTSIPPSAYRTYQAMPPEGRPSGSWLLLAYLRYAEEVEEWFRLLEVTGRDREQARKDAEEARVAELDVRSPLVCALADRLESRAGGALTVGRYWGNDGFCVDLTARHGQARRRGMILDFARYRRAPDAIEWDLFATGLLHAHGWKLRRAFSPQLFRDPERLLDDLVHRATAEASPRPVEPA